jgi:hypothetical protein
MNIRVTGPSRSIRQPAGNGSWSSVRNWSW